VALPNGAQSVIATEELNINTDVDVVVVVVVPCCRGTPDLNSSRNASVTVVVLPCCEVIETLWRRWMYIWKEKKEVTKKNKLHESVALFTFADGSRKWKSMLVASYGCRRF